MARHIYVVAGDRLSPGQNALIEEHPDHPYNSGARAHVVTVRKGRAGATCVARTPEVMQRLADGRLREVPAPEAPAETDTPPAPQADAPDTEDGAAVDGEEAPESAPEASEGDDSTEGPSGEENAPESADDAADGEPTTTTAAPKRRRSKN